MKEKLGRYFRFFISRLFLINFAAGILVFFGLGWFWLDYLESYTNLGQKIQVPSLIGEPLENVDDILEPKGLKYELDSIYVEGELPHTVYAQDPLPTDCTGVYVKENRTIYVTVIRVTPPGKFVNKDELIGRSKRVVLSKLSSLGFKVKETYVPHENDYVLDVLYKGKSVPANEQITIGETIEVVIGKGRKQATTVPSLTGKTINEAKKSLGNTPLKLQVVECADCATKEDSLSAVIYKQSPYGGPESYAPAGSEIDLWLKSAEEAEKKEDSEPEDE